MKKPHLPETLMFQHLNQGYWKTCFFEYVGYRVPRAGEYYLMADVVSAWLFSIGITQKLHIVKPTFEAIQKTIYIKGDPV